jgi:hypothetical protein
MHVVHDTCLIPFDLFSQALLGEWHVFLCRDLGIIEFPYVDNVKQSVKLYQHFQEYILSVSKWTHVNCHKIIVCNSLLW